jgi:urate oxidase
VLEDDTRPKANEIRYFHSEDKAEATNVAQKIKDALGVQLPAVKFYQDDRASPGYFEIWIARTP